MHKKRSLALLLALSLLTGCATIKTQEVRNIPTGTTGVSETRPAEEHQLKRKVAIARFSNETKYGQGFFYDKNEDRLGKQAMDIFSSKLAATNKFLLVERADLDYLNKEKELSKITEAGIPADYLILGSVNEFGRKTTSDVGVFSRTKTQTAYAKVSIRLVEVRTGLVIYSEEGSGEAVSEANTVLGVGGTADYDATLNDKVISAAIGKLVSNITENLSNKPWKSYVLSFTDGSYIIAGGALQGLKEGNELTVYKRGAKVNNPQTGTTIELPGKQTAKLKIVSTVPGEITTEVSLCSLVSGDLPKDNFNEYYVQEK